jgi:Na+-translocating ferredoxin:NAD+ oxidoreductase subunit E
VDEAETASRRSRQERAVRTARVLGREQRENGDLVLFLGLCPALAVSTRLSTALWMSGAILAVLLVSTAAALLLGLAAPRRQGRVRWFLSLAVSAAVVTGAQVLFDAFAPGASASLGLYLPVLAVNCLVVCRTELAARGEPAGSAMRGSLRAGAGLAAAILVIAAVREALGSGTLTLFPAGSFDGILVIAPLAAAPARAAGLACGGLLAAGYLAAAVAAVRRASARRTSRGEAGR